MKKVWNTLVVLGILLCMIMSLGVTADAAEGDSAIFAVSGAQISAESVDVMKTQCPESLVVDVDGLADGQSTAGYNVVYAQSNPGVMSDYAYIWPGYAQMFYVGTQSRLVVLVGVGQDSTAEEIGSAIGGYLGDNPYVIAVGPASAAAAVGGCADVDMFMTSGLDDAGASSAASALGAAKLVNVGQQADYPVSLVKVNGDGTASSEAIPMPQPVADPGVGATEPETSDPNVADEQPSAGDQPAIETQPGTEGDSGSQVDESSQVTYCKIIYDGNGRDSGSVPDVLDFIAGQVHFLSNNGYTRAGYQFIGWKVEGDDTLYQPGDEVTIDHDVTVYAQWEEIPAEPVEEPSDNGEGNGQEPVAEGTFTVTYVPGEGATGTPVVTEGVTSDTALGMEAMPADFAKPGYTFTGWIVNGEHYDVQGPFYVTGDTTVTADWSQDTVEVKNATITFDPNGGTNQTSDPNTQTITDIGEGVDYGLPVNWFTAPEGMAFDAWEIDGTRYAERQEVRVTGDMTVKALWKALDQNVTYAVTYKAGVEGVDDIQGEKTAPGTVFKLPECTFAAPSHQTFDGWQQDGTETLLAAGSDFTMPEADVAFVAKWKSVAIYNVTYKSNVENGPADVMAQVYADDAFTLPGDTFTVEGKTLTGWRVEGTDADLAIGSAQTLTGDIVYVAQWKDNAVAPQDPGLQGETAISWTNGSGNALSVSFTNAAVDAVSVGNSTLKKDVQYTLSNDDKTLTFDKSYLDSLDAGNYAVEITFKPNGDTPYEKKVMTLAVAVPAAEEPEKTDDMELTWAERSTYLSVTFDSQPTKVEIDYGSQGYKETKSGSDYTVQDNTLFLQPDLINKNWGGAWPNARYAFRVTLADGTTRNLKITLSGNIPQASSTAAPTGSAGHVTGDSVNLRAGAGTNTQVLRTVAKDTKITIYSISDGWAYVSVDGVNGYMSANYVAYDNAAPTATPNGPTSPATGDTNNITLYIVLLAVLVVALAAVLIVMVKRKKKQ